MLATSSTLLEATLISCGFPSPAERSGSVRLSLDALVLVRPEATFFMKMESDALIEEGIFEGDLLVVDRSIEPTQGSLVVAYSEGLGFVARRLRRRAGMLILEDGAREIMCDESVIVWGVVTFTLHKV